MVVKSITKNELELYIVWGVARLLRDSGFCWSSLPTSKVDVGGRKKKKRDGKEAG
jgi:hypothetical protein